MNRTEFLISNPKMIAALAIQVGMPFRELDDFKQEVILRSMQEPDNFNPGKAKISTYAGNFIKRRAVDYLRRLRRIPGQLIDAEGVVDDVGLEPA